MTIRSAILVEMKRQKLTRYKVWKLSGVSGAATIYAYLDGSKDITTETADQILSALKLEVRTQKRNCIVK